jgi:hypothetical protein
LANWAGVCPGNRESEGERLSAKPTGGNPWIKAVLSEVAWVITRMREPNYPTAGYRRIARRRGKYKPLVAVAHSLLVIAYHILTSKQPYADLGADCFDTLEIERIQRYHMSRHSALGYDVELNPRLAS